MNKVHNEFKIKGKISDRMLPFKNVIEKRFQEKFTEVVADTAFRARRDVKTRLMLPGTGEISQASIVFMKQNPDKNSEWAELARNGHEVVQIMIWGANNFSGYVGVIVDGTLKYY